MRRYALFAALAGAVVSVLSSCFVGSFDKVDGFDAGGGPGSGASSSTGNAGSGQGGSGGAPDCSDLQCTAAQGETACCFNDPSEGDVCGIRVDDYPVEYCLPPNINGETDRTCLDATIGGRTLEGCCIGSIGLCGVHDPDHESLGCVPGEAAGLAAKACGVPACGALCLSAQANECIADELDLPVFECSIECAVDSANCQGQLETAVACIGGAFDRCSGTGYALTADCQPEHAGLEACWGTEDCNTYCAGVFAACGTDQYETEAQCLAMCEILRDIDALPESADDTLTCRMELTFSASTDAQLCPAAGPAGETLAGGVCGTACQSFCIIDQIVCPEEFAATFSGFLDCEGECSTSFPNSDTGYSTSGTTDASAECRLLHVVRAAELGGDAALCGVANDGSAGCM